MASSVERKLDCKEKMTDTVLKEKLGRDRKEDSRNHQFGF